jgi:hypothetical protein
MIITVVYQLAAVFGSHGVIPSHPIRGHQLRGLAPPVNS